MDARRESSCRPSPLQRFFYWFCWWIVWVAFVLIYRFRCYHARHVPHTGPILIAANHQSHLDPPAIGIACAHRPLHFLARSGLFTGRLFGWLIAALNSIPIKEDASDVAAIRAVIQRLEAGAAVLIFPEGSRSPDGELQEFKRGVALLMKRAGCPVVPAAVEGAFEAFPRHRSFPRLFGCRIAVMFGKPIPADELLKDGPDAALDRLRQEIEAMRRILKARVRPPAA